MKHIAPLLTVSLRYFFNIDAKVFGQALTFIVVLLHGIKIVPRMIAYELYEGSLTINEDINLMRNSLIVFKERWDNSATHEALANIRLFDHFNRSANQ